MTNKDTKKIKDVISDLIKTVASRNDIEVIDKNGKLMVEVEDLPKLEKALDTYIGNYKVV